MLTKPYDLPDCFLNTPPTLIPPSVPTPRHTLYLSNLDDQKFLRFSIKYIYLFRKFVCLDKLRGSLGQVLVDYYPLAGRLRTSGDNSSNDDKLEVDCNGEGAVFVEAFMDITSDEFLDISKWPNKSWRKLLYKVDAHSFLDIPPLIVQVTNLRCGGMILCIAINHCLCDGVGTSQFLHAWAHLTSKSDNTEIPILPFHSRHPLKPRNPPHVTTNHPVFTKQPTITAKNTLLPHSTPNILLYLQSQPLVSISLTFTSSDILQLKRQCVPSIKCTTFEALAAHTWHSWVKSLDFAPSVTVKLLFSVNVRKKLVNPRLPDGYYGNGFVLGCAVSNVTDLVTRNIANGVRLVQEAKSSVTEEYVRSVVDMMEEDRTARVDLGASLVISQWARLGLEELDFGEGKAVHMGPVSSDVYCLFLPVIGDKDAVRVLVSLPECMAERFEECMRMRRGVFEKEDNMDDGGDGMGMERDMVKGLI